MISLETLENIMENSRPIFWNQFKPCDKFTQSKNICHKVKVTTDNILKHVPSTSQTYQYSLSDDDSWNMFTIANQPINELPSYLSEIFDERCYTVTFDNVNGFWYCILTSLDPSFMGRTVQNQKKCIIEFKWSLANDLDDYFEPLHYRGFGFTKSSMLDLLQTNELYDNSLGHYACDYLKLNICIINNNSQSEQTLFWLAPQNAERVTLIMIKQDNKWSVVIHPDGKSHMRLNIFEMLENKFGQSSSIDWTKTSHIETDQAKLKNVKKELKNMKIKQLIEKAEQLEINLVSEETGKKKLKEQILKDVYHALTGNEY